MTEDLSPVYDDVQIREWAHNIRTIKINELRTLIKEKQRVLKDYTCVDGHLSNRRAVVLDEISRLKKKLNIITK
jgi:hypothetical protein